MKHPFAILLFFLCPITVHAQYTDNNRCCISFKTYENSRGKLEYTQNNITYCFYPDCNSWQVVVQNNTDETVGINWRQAGFVINGRASGVTLQPSHEKVTTDIIKSNTEISRTITATNLITEKVLPIYQWNTLKKGRKVSVTISLPISIGKRVQEFQAFDFIVTQAD